MHEGSPGPESVPPISGIDAFENLVNAGVWDVKTETALDELLKTYPDDLYMLYLTYKESGLVHELAEHERNMYERLAKEFE
jgi:hypothetical protein